VLVQTAQFLCAFLFAPRFGVLRRYIEMPSIGGETKDGEKLH
jgi:manganese transport system permease protein